MLLFRKFKLHFKIILRSLKQAPVQLLTSFPPILPYHSRTKTWKSYFNTTFWYNRIKHPIWWLCTQTVHNVKSLVGWPMGGKAKSRCHLGILKVSKLRHRYLNIMKLKYYGPTGECSHNNHQTLQKLHFSVFSH
jgi:hypothetical protein